MAQIYIHFTDLEGMKGIQATGELWGSSYVEGVFAIPVGGHFVPGVQMSKLGRAKSRLAAVFFTTPILPDYCYPEECVWKTDKIPVKIVKLGTALMAKKYLDGSLPSINSGNWNERLLIPTKEIPDPKNPPDFLVNENFSYLICEALEGVLEGSLREGMEEAARGLSDIQQDGLGIYVVDRPTVKKIFLVDTQAIVDYTDIRDVLGGDNAELQAKYPGKTAEDIRSAGVAVKNSIIKGEINVLKIGFVSDDIWSVSSVAAEKGFGPLMYELAMSAVSPAWVSPDNPSSVSPSAHVVWSRFFNRQDVEHKKREDIERLAPDETSKDSPTLYQYRLKEPLNYKGLILNGKDPITRLRDAEGFLNRQASIFFSNKYRKY